MKEGDDKVQAYLDSGMKDINGWKVGSLFGDSAFYKGDWLKRAAAAKGGIYGNDAVEAMYPMTREYANGETLDGSKHNYTLTFPAGQLPPVKQPRKEIQCQEEIRDLHKRLGERQREWLGIGR